MVVAQSKKGTGKAELLFVAKLYCDSNDDYNLHSTTLVVSLRIRIRKGQVDDLYGDHTTFRAGRCSR